MSKAGKLKPQWKVIRKDKRGTNEEGQARARLQNRLQMPLKSTERSVSTLEEVAGQGRRRAEGDCWRCVWSCREIHAHTPRVFWAFISWGHIWKEGYASSALQTILIPSQVSMGEQRPWGQRSWLLLFKRLTNTQPILPQVFHAGDSHSLVASLNRKCTSSGVERAARVSSGVSQLCKFTYRSCVQPTLLSGQQGRKCD